MPYDRNEDLPDSVKVLPGPAQTIWRKAFNAALEEYDDEDTARRVAYNLRTLGRAGTGYIIAPCHNIQANTPMENILALYQAPRDIPKGS